MNKKDLNFKSVILKIFFTYLGVYFFAVIFKYTYDLESLFNNIQYNYLIALNTVSIFLGLPFCISVPEGTNLSLENSKYVKCR